MTDYVKQFEDEVSAWPGISIYAHRFGGHEFRFGKAEVGHVHRGGVVDIPFPRPIHDVLLANGLAGEHRWVPDSGWVTFMVRSDKDHAHALWLMRLSYIRYALKKNPDPRELLERGSEQLRLSEELKSLIGRFVPHAVSRIAEPLSKNIASGD